MLPAKEVVKKSRLSISQLYLLVEDLKTISNSKKNIEVKALLIYFNRLNTNELASVLPDLKSKKLTDFLQIAKNLDKD